eukprot:m.309754 g.309754  ORF g.309754 m.309754 type:complete len:50 (+) comp16371_c1_seq17:4280-4429(+)
MGFTTTSLSTVWTRRICVRVINLSGRCHFFPEKPSESSFNAVAGKNALV